MENKEETLPDRKTIPESTSIQREKSRIIRDDTVKEFEEYLLDIGVRI